MKKNKKKDETDIDYEKFGITKSSIKEDFGLSQKEVHELSKSLKKALKPSNTYSELVHNLFPSLSRIELAMIMSFAKYFSDGQEKTRKLEQLLKEIKEL